MENYQECVKAAQKAIETELNRTVFKNDGLNKMHKRWVNQLKRDLEVAMKHYDSSAIISIIYELRDFATCKDTTLIITYLQYRFGEFQF